MVCTSILMLIFFGAILILGKDYLVAGGFMTADQSMLFYVIQTCLYFAVYLAILQLSSTAFAFVTELTASFRGSRTSFSRAPSPASTVLLSSASVLRTPFASALSPVLSDRSSRLSR